MCSICRWNSFDHKPTHPRPLPDHTPDPVALVEERVVGGGEAGVFKQEATLQALPLQGGVLLPLKGLHRGKHPSALRGKPARNSESDPPHSDICITSSYRCWLFWSPYVRLYRVLTGRCSTFMVNGAKEIQHAPLPWAQPRPTGLNWLICRSNDILWGLIIAGMHWRNCARIDQLRAHRGTHEAGWRYRGDNQYGGSG